MSAIILIFDLGNTLLKYDEQAVVRGLAGLSGRSEIQVREIVFGENDDASIAHFMDSCSFPKERLIQELVLRLRERMSLNPEVFAETICRVFCGHYELDQRIRSLLYFLRHGILPMAAGMQAHPQYCMGILSNNNALQLDFIEKAFPIFAEHSGIFAFRLFSHLLGYGKPDSRSFETAFQHAFAALISRRQNLSVEQCLFFDDREENINAAENFGMRVVLVDPVHPYESIRQGLLAHGVKLPPTELLSQHVRVDFHARRFRDVVKLKEIE